MFSANHGYVEIVRFYHVMFRLHLYELTVLSGRHWGWWCESSVSRLRLLPIFVATKLNIFKVTSGDFAAAFVSTKPGILSQYVIFWGWFLCLNITRNKAQHCQNVKLKSEVSTYRPECVMPTFVLVIALLPYI